MKWAIIAVGSLVALLAIAAAIGAMLPKGHVASRTARYAQPPEQVWAAITGVEEFAAWRAGVKSAERLPSQDGRPGWKEIWSNGTALPLVSEAMEPPRLLRMRIADAELPFGGTWTYEIRPADGGSTLTITEDGEVYNPIFRLISRLTGQRGTITEYHTSLARKFGQPVEFLD